MKAFHLILIAAASLSSAQTMAAGQADRKADAAPISGPHALCNDLAHGTVKMNDVEKSQTHHNLK